jgi:hypothetical protein
MYQYTLRQSSPCRCSPVAIPRQLRDHPFNCLLPICTMNGVCRSLGNATYAITKDRAGPPPSWSPSKELPPSPSTGVATRGLSIFKDCKPSPPGASPSSTNSSPMTTPPPTRMGGSPRFATRHTPTSSDERGEAGEHARCFITEFVVVRSDDGQPSYETPIAEVRVPFPFRHPIVDNTKDNTVPSILILNTACLHTLTNLFGHRSIQ